MRGIILANKSSSKLNPLTLGVSKYLLPIYDKPVIYYPLSILMLMGIQHITVVALGAQKNDFESLLGDGSSYGLCINYCYVQESTNDISALKRCESYVGSEEICVISGDQLFYGQAFLQKLTHAKSKSTGATVFAHQLVNRERFATVKFDKDHNVKALGYKCAKPVSSYAILGIYLFDDKLFEKIKSLTKQQQAQDDISLIHQIYLDNNLLNVESLGRGFTWLGTDSADEMLSAGSFVHMVETRQGFKIACLEEISYRQGWLTKDVILDKAQKSKTQYGKYLLERVMEDVPS